MSIAVTGSTGFLGGALLEACRAEGLPTLGLTRPSGEPDHRADTTLELSSDVDTLARQLEHCDAVVHLAARRGSGGRVADFLPNVELAERVATAASRAGVPLVIHASTGAVYDQHSAGPWREDHVARPVSPYATAKLAAEHAMRLAVSSSTTLVHARLTHLFGAGDRQRFMVNHFVMEASSGRDLHLNMRDERSRDLLYVKDAARALLTIVASRPHDDVVNVGSGTTIDHEQIATLIARQYGVSVVPSEDASIARVADSRLDTTRLTRLGFAPAWTFESAVADLADEVA